MSIGNFLKSQNFFSFQTASLFGQFLNAYFTHFTKLGHKQLWYHLICGFQTPFAEPKIWQNALSHFSDSWQFYIVFYDNCHFRCWSKTKVTEWQVMITNTSVEHIFFTEIIICLGLGVFLWYHFRVSTRKFLKIGE